MKLARKTYTTRNEKIIDFAIGFFGWLLINGLLYGILIFAIQQLPSDTQNSAAAVALIGLPLLLNIAALIFFGVTRRWIALGALAAFAVLLVGALILGLFIYAVCFSMGNL
jgi:hypothetical protein